MEIEPFTTETANDTGERGKTYVIYICPAAGAEEVRHSTATLVKLSFALWSAETLSAREPRPYYVAVVTDDLEYVALYRDGAQVGLEEAVALCFAAGAIAGIAA